MHRYFKVWIYMTSASFQTFFSSRIGGILFLSGKILRFGFFLGFLLLLVTRTKALIGYNVWEVILFYLTFNFIDASTQMLFREVYRFRQHILTGSFDLILVKPVNSLFRSLFGYTDLLDFATLLPFVVMIGYTATKISNINSVSILLYIILIFNSLVLAASFHIVVLALAILTTEIDHTVMIYRDITGMGKIPIDIYQEPIRGFATFVIPVGIMMTYPVKALLGLLNPFLLLLSFFIGGGFFLLSIKLWEYALKKYSSPSG